MARVCFKKYFRKAPPGRKFRPTAHVGWYADSEGSRGVAECREVAFSLCLLAEKLIPRFKNIVLEKLRRRPPGSLVSGVYGEEGGAQVSGPLDVGGSNYWPGAACVLVARVCFKTCSRIEGSIRFGGQSLACFLVARVCFKKHLRKACEVSARPVLPQRMQHAFWWPESASKRAHGSKAACVSVARV